MTKILADSGVFVCRRLVRVPSQSPHVLLYQVNRYWATSFSQEVKNVGQVLSLTVHKFSILRAGS